MQSPVFPRLVGRHSYIRLSLVFVVLFSAIFFLLQGAISVTQVHASSGTPNTYNPDPTISKGIPPRPTPVISGVPHSPTTADKPTPFSHATPILSVDLTATQTVLAKSSDGMLDVAIPAGSITSTDLAAAGGAIRLVVTPVASSSGSTIDGHISLGTYLLQLHNSAGQELSSGAGLRQQVSLIYHTNGQHVPVAFDRFVTVMNGALPVKLPMSVAHLGKNQSFTTRYDATAQTLTTDVALTSSSSSASFITNSPEGFFGKPNIFQNNLQTGTLTNDIAIDLPMGPGRLTPPLKLAYSSGAVNANHNPQGAAPWVGEGWSMDLGQISWSEFNVNSNSTTATWENGWSFTDPFGANAELIPPNTTVSTYFDDTPNPVPTGSPIQWHTAPETHAKIISYTNPTVDCTYFPQSNVCGSGNYPLQPPCWRVWLPNGIMEEFGCTPDSRQWYPGGPGGTTKYPSVWKLDMIVDPSGNQIHASYKQDFSTSNGVSYVRDIVLDHIEYDSVACHDTQAMCTGAAWNPQMKVIFNSSNTVTHPYPGAHSCSAQSNGIRCDDPAPAIAPALGTPLITQTQVLNDFSVQVNANGIWNTLRSYQFSYDQSAPAGSILDPVTGNGQNIAGYLLLDQLVEYGTDGTTHYSSQTFKYANPDGEWYEDSLYHPAAGVGCGPSWNTGNKPSGNTGCVLWQQSYNTFYLSEADNGQGAQQTFSWLNMRTNQHGVDATQNALDPSYCTNHQSGNYPCDLADDNGWSVISLTSRTVTVQAPTTAKPTNTISSTWNYVYNLSSLTAQECSDCTVGFYWGNANNGDYLDFYEGQYRGYAFAQVINPDNSAENDYFNATTGWGVYDNSQVGCYDGQPVCPNDPYWSVTNAASGRPYQVDIFNPQVGGTYPLMRRTLTNYTVTCPPAGVTGTPPQAPWGNFNGNLVEELNFNNPVASCDIQVGSTKVYLANGINAPTDTTVPYATTTNSYNSYGQMTQSTVTGNDLGSTPTITHTFDYVWNDAITATNTSATGTYLVDRIADSFTKDGAGTVKGCAYDQYDGASYTTGQSAGLTQGLRTGNMSYASCANKTGLVNPTTNYNANGDPISTLDADANSGISGHKSTSGTCNGTTSCITYDTRFGNLVTGEGNALNQSTAANFNSTSNFGFGLWPASSTDLNGQVSSATYDALGRVTSMTAPGETSGLTTTASIYANWCPTVGANAPCLESDTTQRLDSGTTVTSRSFYDGFGRQVETRSPAPGSQDVIQYTMYNGIGKTSFQSLPYYVTAYTGGPGVAAYATPDSTKVGTSYAYNGLQQVTSVTDALSHVRTTAYTTACNIAGTSDTACYMITTTVDSTGHQSASDEDAAGRTIYAQDWTGTSGSYVLYRTVKASYDTLGRTVTTTYADGSHTSRLTYNDLGQIIGSNDPDLGAYTFTYDANSNTLNLVDPRGTTGTTYIGYDGLNRMLWQSTNSTGSNPFATYTYDSTVSGNKGIGRLTSKTFTSGPTSTVTGSYAYTYDSRGRVTTWNMTLNGTAYPFTFGYNDANQSISLQYPDGDTVTTNYGSQDWLNSITEKLGATTNTLLSNVTYTGASGAAGLVTAANVGNTTYSWNLAYDTLLRLTDTTVKKASTNTTLYDQVRSYDAIGNVLTANTTLPAGTDNQRFCYDSLNRLTWAGAKGTPPTGCGTLTTGTLTSAQYTQTYSYDTLDRLTSGAYGASYTYGDSTHLNAVTKAGSGTNTYTAAYDSAGDMTCRALTTAQTCSGTPTGQKMTYDGLRRLLLWQNATVNPTQTSSYAYNGAGERVWTQTNNAGTVTTTQFIGGYEEIKTSGSTTTTTKYYKAGVATAVSVNGTISYMVNDGLGSVNVALSASGGVSAVQLYTPYGAKRYSTGTMPTQYGFTGEYLDSSGLNYFHARYYDSTVGQFTCADSVQGPNRYGYVGGNPETLTDPTGHDWWNDLGSAVSNTVSTVGNLAFGVSDIGNDINTIFNNPNASGWDIFGACVNLTFNVVMDASYFVPGLDIVSFGVDALMHVGEDAAAHVAADGVSHLASDVVEHVASDGLAQAGTDGAAHALESGAASAGGDAATHAGDQVLSDGASHAADDGAGHAGGCNSFQGNTLVTTPTGQVPIDTVQVGDHVVAYDMATGQTQAEPVQHVFINHDNNLLDVTLALPATSQTTADTEMMTDTQHEFAIQSHSVLAGPNASTSTSTSQGTTETIHTTTEHPFLTTDRGFVDAVKLVPGEYVKRLDGSVGIVVAVRVTPGVSVRYNLTVRDLHSFAVGQEQWVVHNCGSSGQPSIDQLRSAENIPASRNIAYADSTLGGVVDHVHAVSGADNPTSWIRAPQDANRIVSSSVQGFRKYDSEVKILEHYASQLTADPLLSGTIEAFTERPPCTSCEGVIQDFIQQFGDRVTLTFGW